MNENYQKTVYTILTVAGIVLFTIGFTVLSPEEYSRISGVFIGIGVGLAAAGFSLLVISISNSKLPEEVKKQKKLKRMMNATQRSGKKPVTKHALP